MPDIDPQDAWSLLAEDALSRRGSFVPPGVGTDSFDLNRAYREALDFAARCRREMLLRQALAEPLARPQIVCLCGTVSAVPPGTHLKLTLAGRLVLRAAWVPEDMPGLTDAMRSGLATLDAAAVTLSDEVLAYGGTPAVLAALEATRRQGKPIRHEAHVLRPERGEGKDGQQ